MTGRWPFKKMPYAEASSSTARKKPSPKKERNRPYMDVAMAQVPFDQNQTVGLRDIHLPGGWHLNAGRVPVPPEPCCGRERHDEILRRRAILPQDLR
jgi:hypothetical protein